MKKIKHKTYEWTVEEGSLKLFVDDQKPYLSLYIYDDKNIVVEELFYTGDLAEKFRPYFKKPARLAGKLLNILNREFNMSDYEKIILDRDDEKKLSFTGRLIASAFTTPGRDGSYPSGETGRAESIELYETKGKKFVCNHVWTTQWQGERDRNEVFIVESEKEVIDIFGQSDMAKRLYEEAGIDSIQDLDDEE